MRKLAFVFLFIIGLLAGCRTLPIECQITDDIADLRGTDTASLAAWHRSGYCGQDITIGLLLFDGTPDVWVDQYHNLINATAPAAQVIEVSYTADTSRLTPDLNQAADDYIRAIRELRNRGATIIVNLVAFPGFAVLDNPAVAVGIHAEITNFLLEADTYWINAVGMFGQSHYAATFRPGSIRAFHEFDNNQQYLHIGFLDATQPVSIFWLHQDSTIDFEVSINTDTDINDRVPVFSSTDQLPLTYQRIAVTPASVNNANNFYLFLASTEAENAQGKNFALYLTNGVFLSDHYDASSLVPPALVHERFISVGACPMETRFAGIPLATSQGQVETETFPEIIGRGIYQADDDCRGSVNDIGQYSSSFATVLTAGSIATIISSPADTNTSCNTVWGCLASAETVVDAIPLLNVQSPVSSFNLQNNWSLPVTGFVVIVVFIFLIIAGRYWAKREQQKSPEPPTAAPDAQLSPAPSSQKVVGILVGIMFIVFGGSGLFIILRAGYVDISSITANLIVYLIIAVISLLLTTMGALMTAGVPIQDALKEALEMIKSLIEVLNPFVKK